MGLTQDAAEGADGDFGFSGHDSRIGSSLEPANEFDVAAF